jgi:hypothetical protein
MGVKDQLRFLSSGRVPEGKSLIGQVSPLAGIRLSSGGSHFAPILDQLPSEAMWVSLSVWWNEERIFSDGEYSLTREALVFALRNQDGGGHLDPELSNRDYVRLSREHGMCV